MQALAKFQVAALALFVSLMFSLHANATTSPQSIASGLEAQYQAAVIRERRLADERDQRLIAESEARLIRARRQADVRVAGADAALERARAEHSQTVQEIFRRHTNLQAEFDAYRAEVQGIVAQATPERLAALQRFADGDRMGAWPILEALRAAEDGAVQRAASARRAVRWREDARLRETMWRQREATVEDVLELWDQAALLDTLDTSTALRRSNLRYVNQELGVASEVLDGAIADCILSPSCADDFTWALSQYIRQIAPLTEELSHHQRVLIAVSEMVLSDAEQIRGERSPTSAEARRSFVAAVTEVALRTPSGSEWLFEVRWASLAGVRQFSPQNYRLLPHAVRISHLSIMRDARVEQRRRSESGTR